MYRMQRNGYLRLLLGAALCVAGGAASAEEKATKQQVSDAATTLGAGGGAPGRVFQTYLAATRAADVDALLPTVIAMQADAIRERRGQSDLNHLMQLNQRDALTDVVVSGGQVYGGEVDGAKATLQFTGKQPDGTAMAGSVDLKFEDGAWRVKQVKERR